jgi:DNA polymerase III delta prime subunit
MPSPAASRPRAPSLDNPTKPIGVFMLVGPSGVGKTETALTLAEALYGGEQNVITINMSEFQEAHTVSTLKGAPPGYVGYGEGGVLTEAVRRRPYSVVLLDEVEKAHPTSTSSSSRSSTRAGWKTAKAASRLQEHDHHADQQRGERPLRRNLDGVPASKTEVTAKHGEFAFTFD